MLASVNDLRPEMGVASHPAAAPSFISTSVGDLFTGPYPNPNPKRDPNQAGHGGARGMSECLNRHARFRECSEA